MPQATDLVGVGVPPIVAAILGNQASTVTCAGTTQATGTTVKTHNVELSAAGSATGALLPSGALIGTPYYAFCSSSTSAVLYVPVGHYLNGTQNVGLTIAQNKAAVVWQYKGSNWASILTA